MVLSQMPSEVSCHCPYCNTSWGDLIDTSRIGHQVTGTPVRKFRCQLCLQCLFIATDFDRISFSNWFNGNNIANIRSGLLRHNGSLINSISADTRGYLLDLSALWDQLYCPDCDRRLIEYTDDDNESIESIECRNCHSLKAKAEFTGVIVSTMEQFDDLEGG